MFLSWQLASDTMARDKNQEKMLQYSSVRENSPPVFLPRHGENVDNGCLHWQWNQPETSTLFHATPETPAFGAMFGKSAAMQAVFKLIAQVAATDATVLVQGETGTGKELVARAIHQNSARRHKPFVAINCAALSENLLESELFGHEKGAFTGAVKSKPGRFELADGGVLFLDEVGDIPLSTQIKLLRVIQEKAFERVGGTETIRTDFRIISATNKNLKKAIREGAFREDLYYRLNVLPVVLTPLRERKEDIPLLVRSFVDRFVKINHKRIEGIALAAMSMLLRYPWPGNVRELENVLERAVVLCDGPQIEVSHLLFLTQESEYEFLNFAVQQRLQESELTKLYAHLILNEQEGNKKEACKILGINFRTLQNRLSVYKENFACP
jgi:transcriptional regulator with PAS, ATPase and Fis domain